MASPVEDALSCHRSQLSCPFPFRERESIELSQCTFADCFSALVVIMFSSPEGFESMTKVTEDDKRYVTSCEWMMVAARSFAFPAALIFHIQCLVFSQVVVRIRVACWWYCERTSACSCDSDTINRPASLTVALTPLIITWLMFKPMFKLIMH